MAESEFAHILSSTETVRRPLTRKCSDNRNRRRTRIQPDESVLSRAGHPLGARGSRGSGGGMSGAQWPDLSDEQRLSALEPDGIGIAGSVRSFRVVGRSNPGSAWLWLQSLA